MAEDYAKLAKKFIDGDGFEPVVLESVGKAVWAAVEPDDDGIISIDLWDVTENGDKNFIRSLDSWDGNNGTIAEAMNPNWLAEMFEEVDLEYGGDKEQFLAERVRHYMGEHQLQVWSSWLDGAETGDLMPNTGLLNPERLSGLDLELETNLHISTTEAVKAINQILPDLHIGYRDSDGGYLVTKFYDDWASSEDYVTKEGAQFDLRHPEVEADIIRELDTYIDQNDMPKGGWTNEAVEELVESWEEAQLPNLEL